MVSGPLLLAGILGLCSLHAASIVVSAEEDGREEG